MNTQMWVHNYTQNIHNYTQNIHNYTQNIHNYTQNIHNYLSTRSHASEEESRTIEITAKIGSVNGL
jgi:membrane-bound lytic murein transglycosylase MltF